jgi:DUF438 domain-containing protein
MEIGSKTKVMKLVENYPFLIEFLGELNPQFKKLSNPVLRNTIGKFATLQMAASMGSMEVEKLIQAITHEISEKTGENITVDKDGGSSLDQEKLEKLKSIILRLHDGEAFEQLQKEFAEEFKDVESSEIAEMEQQLLAEGMPQEEIKKLCDVHVAMFKDSLSDIALPEMKPGHPLHTYLEENKALLDIINSIRMLQEKTENEFDPVRFSDEWNMLSDQLTKCREIDKHYLRKENQLFPKLENVGFTGPSQVMWAIHDDIRADFKTISNLIDKGRASELTDLINTHLTNMEEMVYKEEKILFPVCLELLSHEDWAEVKKGEDEFGYTLIKPGNEWNPRIKFNIPIKDSKTTGFSQKIPLDVGLLDLDQLNLILKHLPVELSFVDENDEVRYYSEVPHKIFPRSPQVIGRKVQNCHPPKSLHMVEAILSAFKKGERDVADFWIEMGDMFVYIRYFAVRDKDGSYRGTLEVVQDVKHIRELEGQRRLLEWD